MPKPTAQSANIRQKTTLTKVCIGPARLISQSIKITPMRSRRKRERRAIRIQRGHFLGVTKGRFRRYRRVCLRADLRRDALFDNSVLAVSARAIAGRVILVVSLLARWAELRNTVAADLLASATHTGINVHSYRHQFNPTKSG